MVITGRRLVYAWLGAVGVIAIALAVFFATNGPSNGSTSSTSNAASVPATTPAAAAEITGVQWEFLAKLDAIDRRLTDKKARTLGRAENSCVDIRGGEFDQATLVERVRYRYDGGDIAVNTNRAAQILEAIISTGVCDSFR